MTGRSGAVFVAFLACVTMWHLPGCRAPDQTKQLMQALHDGQARGHLVVTSPGILSVGMQYDFYIGAKGTTLSFDGDIDFTNGKTGGRHEGTEAQRHGEPEG